MHYSATDSQTEERENRSLGLLGKAYGSPEASEVPRSVHDVLGSPGQPLDAYSRAKLESRFGCDFGHVRVHNDGMAARSAAEVAAAAYSVGSHIVFGANRHAPRTLEGERLMAHELSHTVQQRGESASQAPQLVSIAPSGSSLEREADAAAEAVLDGRRPSIRREVPATPHTLQRQLATERSADLGVRFNDAIGRSDWQAGARAVEEMSDSDAQAALAALPSRAREQLRAAAMTIDPAGSSRTVRLIEIVERTESARERRAPTGATTSTGEDIAGLSASQKLARAWGYARGDLAEEAVREMQNLFTPESLAIMVGFVAAYVAAQLTPVGWVADAIALASLTVAAFFMGRILFSIIEDLYTFFSAVNATTDGQLRADGRALARAIARGGLQIIILILTRGIRGGRGGGGGRPYRSPPPAEYVEAVTDTGLVVRMPAQAAAELPGATGVPGMMRGAAPLSRGPIPELPGRVSPGSRPGTARPPANEPISGPARPGPGQAPEAQPRPAGAPLRERLPTPVPIPPPGRRRDPGAYPIFWPSVFGPPMLFDTPIVFFQRTTNSERDQDYAWEVRRELWARHRGSDPDLMPRDWHAHHIVPLFLGGLEGARGNVTFLPGRLHLAGHGQLASQPQMETPPPPLRPLPRNILDPAHIGVRYELSGFK